MNITEQEKHIVSLFRKLPSEESQTEIIKAWCQTGRDITNPQTNVSIDFYEESLTTILERVGELKIKYEAYIALKELLIYKFNNGNIYSDIIVTLYPDGNYEYKYWYDEERVYKVEFDYAKLGSKDFPHAMAKALVFYHLEDIKFKRKYNRIIMTFEIKDGEPFVDLYLINGRKQTLPVYDSEKIEKYGDIISENTSNVKTWLKEHYENTNHGILKDIWKPWNKIVVSVPPSGYLNELEDIHYYLDEVELEKDFFLKGY